MRTAFLALVLAGGIVCDAAAQTPFFPYYGKNKIRYDDFKDHWRKSKSLYDALNDKGSKFDDDFTPERVSFEGRDVEF